MTEKVIAAVTGVLEKELAKLDTTIGKISIQKPVDELWDKLQKPISIAKGQLWFRIRPQEVALGPITATDSTLTARLDLQAKPRIRAGERPPDDTMPLPPLGRTKAVVDTVDVLIEGTLYYAAANKVLAKEVTGKSIGKGWKRVKIESIVARPGGQGRMLLGVTISGAAEGTVYVIGTPHYDSVAKLITVPDLAFDVKSQGYLESAAGWLINGPLLDEVRSEAKLPVEELLHELVQIVNKEINRPLAEGIYLRGAVERRPRAQRAGGAARASSSTRRDWAGCGWRSRRRTCCRRSGSSRTRRSALASKPAAGREQEGGTCRQQQEEVARQPGSGAGHSTRRTVPFRDQTSSTQSWPSRCTGRSITSAVSKNSAMLVLPSAFQSMSRQVYRVRSTAMVSQP